MRLTKIARTYSKSLLDLAVEKGVLEEVKKDMETVLNVCQESKELQLLLNSPIVPSDKKLNILKSIFQPNLSEFSYSFIELAAKKGREGVLVDLAYTFGHIYLEHKNILKAVVKSVDGVSEALKEKVRELVKTTYQKEVLIEEVKDASLIGGFVITVGDRQVDASVSKQLAKMHNSFSENPYIAEV